MKTTIFQKSKLLSIGIMVSVLSACAPPPIQYAKTGAAPGEWPQVRAECLIEASKTVPANNQYSVAPGESFGSHSCTHGGKDCSGYSEFAPPSVQTTDANSDVRQAVYQACLAKHGWLEVQPNQ